MTAAFRNVFLLVQQRTMNHKIDSLFGIIKFLKKHFRITKSTAINIMLQITHSFFEQ